MIFFIVATFGVIHFVARQLNIRYSLPIYDYLFIKIFGWIFLGIGIVITFHCVYLFIKIGKGTPVPIYSPKKFVVVGLYRFVRNPMYLAVFLIILLEFFISGYITLLFYLLTAVLISHIFVVFYEEENLKRRFEKNYIKYTKKVPRWIPRFNIEN